MTLIFIKNQDSQESSNPHFSNTMLDGDISSAATSQGDSHSSNECESGQGEFTCMIACSPYMDTIYETYGCSFVHQIINRLEKEKYKYNFF